MAFDEGLAERIRELVADRPGVSEKKMFGGLAFMIDDKMFCGVSKDELLARVGPDGHAAAMAKPGVRPMDFTGKPMVGYVFVAPSAVASDRALASWVEKSFQHAKALPAKKPKRKPAAKRR